MISSGWELFTGSGKARERLPDIPEPPEWRRFGWEDPTGYAPKPTLPEPPPEPEAEQLAGLNMATDTEAILMVNAALRLRRPLLVTGPPGAGKSTLARLVARELGLGRVLRWPITSSTRLVDGLYEYDAIGWVQEQNTIDKETDPRWQRRIGRFIRLGPLGTALLPWRRPRVLLIDEIDKADIDLPNDLLHVFEEGEFPIPMLFRLDSGVRDAIEVLTDDRHVAELGAAKATGVKGREVRDGVVSCTEFPLVLMTSNGERAFPQAFLRRCLRLELKLPSESQLRAIVESRIAGAEGDATEVIERFAAAVRSNRKVAVDQVLNAIFILQSAGDQWDQAKRDEITKEFLRGLE